MSNKERQSPLLGAKLSAFVARFDSMSTDERLAMLEAVVRDADESFDAEDRFDHIAAELAPDKSNAAEHTQCAACFAWAHPEESICPSCGADTMDCEDSDEPTCDNARKLGKDNPNRCRNCDAALLPTAKFCHECGDRVDKT